MRILPVAGIDVLFVAYGGGHVTMLRPVAQAAIAAGMRIGFLGLTTAQADLKRNDLDYFGFAELEGANDPDVQALGRELVGPEMAVSPVPYHESVAYHGLSFRDLVADVGEDAARQRYSQHARQAFLPVQTMTTMLESLRPKVVVATNSPRAERALFHAAASLSIPSVCVVDLFAIQEVKWITQPGYADVICVLNEQVRQWMVENGSAPHQVLVTGNPAFDALTDGNSAPAGLAFRAEKKFSQDDKVILWASNVEPERHPFTGAPGNSNLPRQIEAQLRDIISHHDDWRLVVRYHPSETVPFVPQPNVSLSERSEALHILVHAVDVVVVMSSTVGLEAHLAGRPVISVEMSVFAEDAPYSRMGISDGVTQLDQLEAKLVTALSSESRVAPSVRSSSATKLVLAQISLLLDKTAY